MLIENIILYIVSYINSINKSDKLSAVKLNKILWFASREYLYLKKELLFADPFIKMPLGPVPKNIDKILKSLEQRRELKILTLNILEKSRKEFIALKTVDNNDFNSDALACIHKAIDLILPLSAKTASNLSHDELYKSLENGDIMPVESVFFRDLKSPSQEALKWGKSALEKLNCAEFARS